MAIGTLAAIGLGAAGIGSAIGASKTKKAAGKAADASLQATQENNALAREMYGKNEGYLSPYISTGNTAGSYLNAFLGLPPAQQAAPAPTMPPAQNSQLLSGNAGGIVGAVTRSMFPKLAGEVNGLPPVQQAAPVQQPVVAPAVTGQDAQNAFGSYIDNSDYGFQFATGANQVNSGFAGSGALQSGAAMKALEKYRQNLQSGYRNEYMSALGNQQGVGLSAGSALAGVGQNYVNTISANNNSAADAVGNAALVKAKNNPFASLLGTVGGGLLGFGS